VSGQPLVSVIMIFLDAERFIEEALASVFAQTYRNWELLLVDDGSSDGSTTIARRHAASQPDRVRYFEHLGHVNRGMSASRNLGLANARGEYIAFLDADDIFLPERLARHVAMLETRPEVDAVQGEILVWHSWQGHGGCGAPDRMAPDLSFAAGSVLEPPTLLLMLLDTEWCTSPGVCNVTLRRRLVATIGGFEDSFRGLREDDVFFSKVYLAARVGLLGDCLAWYRQHADSCLMMARRNGSYLAGQRAYLRWLESYLAQRGVRDRRLLDALKRQTWPMRHPWLSRLRILPKACVKTAIGAMRAMLQFALPGFAYGRLARWRGASKDRRWHARLKKRAMRSLGRETVAGPGGGRSV
jgi:glycosyltransferase involved in cell wall biosynthesis